MSSEPSNSSPLMSAEERDSATREIDARGPDEDGVTKLDDEPKDKVVPIPIPLPVVRGMPAEPDQPAGGGGTAANPPAPGSGAGSAAQAAPGAAGFDTNTDATSARPCVGGGALPHPQDAPTQRGGAPAAPAVQTASANRLYRAVDKTLDLLHRPIARLSPQTRHIIGLVGIVTLIFAVAIGYVLPLLMPRGDAFTFLEDKRAELLVAPPKDSPGNGTNDDDVR